LRSANALLGPVPHLSPGINDKLAILDKRARSKVSKALTTINRRFPQVSMHVVIREFNPDYSISTHLFWLFNQGLFCPSEDKGGKNHSILLGLDTTQGRVGIIVGYGLEPFLSRKSLDEVLKKSQPLLGNADYSGAILTIIDGVYDLMQKICEDLKDILDRSEMECSHPNEY
jgi:uncharacterized membrane protein YgcG